MRSVATPHNKKLLDFGEPAKYIEYAGLLLWQLLTPRLDEFQGGFVLTTIKELVLWIT